MRETYLFADKITAMIFNKQLLKILMKFSVLCVFIYSTLIITGCGSQKQFQAEEVHPPANRIIIEDRLNAVFSDISEEIPGDNPLTIVISGINSVKQSYAEMLATSFFQQKGLNLLHAGPDYLNHLPDREGNGTVLSLIAQDISVIYNSNNNEKLSRVISVQVMCKVIDKNSGKVLTAETISKVSEDIIAQDEVAQLEDPEMIFTLGSGKTEKRSWKDYLELGSVFTAAGVIIYLLFSTRS